MCCREQSHTCTLKCATVRSSCPWSTEVPRVMFKMVQFSVQSGLGDQLDHFIQDPHRDYSLVLEEADLAEDRSTKSMLLVLRHNRTQLRGEVVAWGAMSFPSREVTWCHIVG